MGRENDIMGFEICGKDYKLSDYDYAIILHKEQLESVFPILCEFPYTIRKLRGDGIKFIESAPVFIQYKGEKTSIYKFLVDNRLFESQIPLSKSTNGLERKYDLELAFRPFQKKDDYNSVIYETFRILQDFHFITATARWALLQAHRILHFRSSLIWDNGWEQLWTRATWLNNALILYDSSFDKLMQAIWIGTEGYSIKNKYQRLDLSNIKTLEDIYQKCWRRADLDSIKMDTNFKNPLVDFYNLQTSHSVAQYAQKIKHRGGMRYNDLFPFGQIGSVGLSGYNPSRTRNSIEIDNVVEIVKEYHIGICALADNIVSSLIEMFKKHGYLTGEDINL